MQYQVFHLRDSARPGSANLTTVANDDLNEQARYAGHEVFGIFASLFGLASNEIYLVTFGESPLSLSLPDGIQLVSNHLLNPTIRPQNHRRLIKQGVYVFRWFSVTPDSVDEIVHLSGEAWPTFEGNFETEIQGLFVEAKNDPSEMLLITWYKDLGVWEASRHPPADARDNFLRRHQLTLSATPIATMLTLPDGENQLVSHT